MSPIRLFILAVLFYIAWHLFKSLVKKKRAGGKQQQTKTTDVKDMLVEDPVCHTLIPKGQAIRLRQKGKTYYFCSEKCCDTFTRKTGGKE